MHRTAPHAARISSSMVFSFIVFELSRAPIVRGRGVLSFIGERLRFALGQNTGTRRKLSLRTLTRARGRHLRSCRTSLFLFLAVLPQNTKRKTGENYSISFHFQCSFPSSSINENGVKSSFTTQSRKNESKTSNASSTESASITSLYVISIFIFRLMRRRLARLVCCYCLRSAPAHYHGGRGRPEAPAPDTGGRVQGSGFRITGGGPAL